MRISDWSSDVCSSDLFEVSHMGFSTQRGRFNKTSGKIVLDRAAKHGSIDLMIDVASLDMGFPLWDEQMASEEYFNTESYRSEARRVGEGYVSTCRSRWSPYP